MGRPAWMLAAVLILAGLGFWLLRGTEPPSASRPTAARTIAPPPPAVAAVCREEPAFAAAAIANAASLRSMPVAGFGRLETGWEVYAPLVQREVATRCGPQETGFAAALARWQAERKEPADGVMKPETVESMRVLWHRRRPVVGVGCPGSPPESELAAAEGYGGKPILLRPGALAAWREMVAAARAESPQIAADPRLLTIFSAFRGPAEEAARCAPPNVCDGRVRAGCSPHRTGLAVDLYVGAAPGMAPSSSDDANRLHQTRGPAYRWLVANADRFGFVPYPFEPWHWEWTGEALRPSVPWGPGRPAAPPAPAPGPAAPRAPA